MVGRGTVSSIKGTKAVVSGSSGITTPELRVPEIMQFDKCCDNPDCNCKICKKLKVGEVVVYALFADNTGSILERL